MSISRKQALAELKIMFPGYDKTALNTLLRANGNSLHNPFMNSQWLTKYADNMLN